MWQIVHIVEDEEKARNLEQRLSSRGFLIKIDRSGTNNFEVKAPPSEADAVYELLIK